ncbi:MAG: TolC family protein [Comamonadaceae bacterium]
MHTPLFKATERSYSIPFAFGLIASYALVACGYAQTVAPVSNGISTASTSRVALASDQSLKLSDLAGSASIDLPGLDDDSAASANVAAKAISLPNAVAQALRNSAQLSQVRAQYESSEARVGVVRADLLPNASLRWAGGPEKTESTTTNNHQYTSQSARLTQPLFNIPLYKEFDSSRQSKDATALRLQAMRETTALAAARATVDLAVARITLNFSDDQLDQLNKILSYLEARTSAGAASQADLERARTRVLAARQTRLEQQTNYSNAMQEIYRLTGASAQTLHLPSVNQLPAVPGSNNQIREMVKAKNFELLALKKEVDAQQSLVTAEYTKYLPVVGASLEYDSTENVGGTNALTTNTRALVVMTWNLSLGGKEYFAAQQASAELRSRQAKLDDETQRTTQATEADLTLLQSSSLRLQAAQAEQTSAQSVVNAVNEQLKTGRMGSLLEALDASDRLFGARSRITQALGQQMKAQAQLLNRLGLLSDVQSQSNL